MLLQRLLIAMVLAAIIEFAVWHLSIKFFEWRFLKKAESICFLYDSVYQFIDNNFEDAHSVNISLKYKHRKIKIKFHNSSEAMLKIELLIQRALKNYKIVKMLIEGRIDESEKFEIDECKEYLESMREEMK